jgi:hypothetical protein
MALAFPSTRPTTADVTSIENVARRRGVSTVVRLGGPLGQPANTTVEATLEQAVIEAPRLLASPA